MPDDQPLPEVAIPPPESGEPGAEKPKKKAGKRSKKSSSQRHWERVRSWAKIAVAIAVTVFAGIPTVVAVGLLVASLLVLIFHRHSLDLDTIGVPETLSKAGFTSEVATQHLRDAIWAVQQKAQGIAKTATAPAESSMPKGLQGETVAVTGIDIDQDLSKITIPNTGLSLQSVAMALRSLVSGWRNEVSGEFVQSANGISLRLRHNIIR